MPSIAEVLLNVQGQSEGAQQAVRSVADEIRRVPNTATATFRAVTTDLDAKLKAADVALRDIDRTRVSPTISAKIDRLLADVTQARAYLDTLPDHKVIDLQARSSIETTLARISAQMAAMGVQAGQWGDELERAARSAEERIPRTVDVDLRLTKQNLERDLNDAEQTLRLFSGRSDLSPEAHLKIDQLAVDVLKARALLDTLPDSKTVDLKTKAGIEQDLLRVKNLITDVTGEAEKGSQAFAQMGSAAGSSGGGGMGNLLDELGSLSPLIQGVAIVLLVALIPALGALVASLGSAAAGVGALAAAFAGALGPGVLLMLDVFKRLTDVMQAYQATSNATQATQRANTAGSQEAAQNAEQQYQATQAVAKAQDNLRQSYVNLADARRQAAQGLVQTQHDEANAVYQEQQAAQQAAQAEVDAYRAVQDAIQRVRDAVLALENAQLGMQDAKLRIDSAKQALVDFRQQAGLTGQAFDSLFKRLTNVNLEQNPQVVAGLLKQITEQGGLKGDDAIRLRQLILDLAHAQVDATGAADNLKKAQTDLTRARQDEIPYLQRGIAAYKPYIDALHAQADAQYNEQKATDAANLAKQQGVEQNPQVLAATKAVENANISLADAQHRLALATAYGPSSVQSAMEQANEAMARLTPTERALVGALQQFVSFIQGAVGPAVDAVFGGLIVALQTAQRIIGALSGDIRQMGTAFGGAIALFAAAMGSPHMVDNWKVLTDAAGHLATILGGHAFASFVELMTNFARAAMPELIKLANQLAVWLAAAAAGTDNIKALATWLQPFFNSLQVWLTALSQVMDLVVAFFRQVGPYGDQLVRYLGSAFENMAKWLNSKQGQQTMREFFQVITPMSIQLVTTLGKLGITFLLALQFMAPAITAMLRALNTFLGILNTVLGVLNHLPTPIRTLLGAVVTLLGAFAGFKFITTLFPRLGVAILEAFRPLITVGGWLVRFLGNPLEWIGSVVRTFVIPALETIGEVIAGVAAVVGAPIELIVAAIAAVAAAAYLLLTHFDDVKAGWKIIWQDMESVANTIGGAIAGAFDWVINAIKDAINWIIGAWDWFADKWNSTPLGGGIHFGTPIGNVDIGGIKLPHIDKLALGGVVSQETLALLGEKPGTSEAVLPLTDDVYSKLGDAIAKKLPGGAKGAGITQHNTFNIASPAGTQPDPAFVTSRIADNMRRRGLNLIGAVAG